MYTIEQITEALAKHEAIEGYDGIEECLCGVEIGGGLYVKDGRTWGTISYDKHLQAAVVEELKGLAAVDVEASRKAAVDAYALHNDR